MKRCNAPAEWVSWFNGYRVCSDCYRKLAPHEGDALVRQDEFEPRSLCDRPVETREEFFKRHSA